MPLGRRRFVELGLCALGGGVAGAANATDSSSPATEAPEGTLALTPDGRLVAVPHQSTSAPAPTPPDVRRGIPGCAWVMVIDLAECAGCPRCAEACAEAHFIPTDREWLRILTLRDAPATAPYWLPRPCQHCDDPPCTRVCPVGATFKRTDGIVLVDTDRCIGCRFCMAACPYSARVFNWFRPSDPPEAHERGCSPEWGYPRRVGTVEKCDFCPDRAREGLLPHCVESCPMGAMYFGDANEDAVTNSNGVTKRLATLLRDRAAHRYLEDLGTRPRVFYLSPSNRRYPAPGEPDAEAAHQQREPVSR
jgi:molybdopterin-containing oxidoreductase family iron-sulfur binding subunit